MFKKKKARISQREERANIINQAGLLNSISGTKENMAVRCGDIPTAQKIGILNMLRKEKQD